MSSLKLRDLKAESGAGKIVDAGLRRHDGLRRLKQVAVLLALAGCAQPPPPPAPPPPPPPPVGHVYSTLVAPPLPVSRYVKFTPQQALDYQQAFNVIGLKSALMVGALSCQQQDRYDAFMGEFRPHVAESMGMLDTYFRRIYGATWRTREDAFVTLLANNQTMTGIGKSTFCLDNAAEFDAVMKLHAAAELDAFVTDTAPPGTPPMPVSTPVVHHVYAHAKKVVHASAAKTQ
jgi:hypothetical protein